MGVHGGSATGKDAGQRLATDAANGMRQQSDRQGVATGGDVNDCLTAQDIDEAVALFKDANSSVVVLPARAFFDVRTGAAVPGEWGKQILAAVTGGKRAVLPMHTRHHWLTAVISGDSDGHAVRAQVYDSAPSPMVQRDIVKVLPRMFEGLLVDIAFMKFPRQRPKSNECGLFVVLAVVATVAGAEGMPKTTNKWSLGPWREILRKAAVENRRVGIRELVQAIPKVAEFVSEHGTTSIEGGGGGPKCKCGTRLDGEGDCCAAACIYQQRRFKRDDGAAPVPQSQSPAMEHKAVMKSDVGVTGARRPGDPRCILIAVTHARTRVKSLQEEQVSDESEEEQAEGDPLGSIMLQCNDVKQLPTLSPEELGTLLAAYVATYEEVRKERGTTVPPSVDAVCLPLRRLPEQLHDKLRPLAQEIARRNDAKKAFHWNTAEFLSSTVEEAGMDGLRTASRSAGLNVLLIAPSLLELYFGTGRPVVKGPTLGCVAIASIVNLDNQHWVAVCWKGGVVSVFDSLLGEAPPGKNWMSPTLRWKLGRFRSLINDFGLISTEEVRVERVPKQREVECGLCALENVARFALGDMKFTLCREDLRCGFESGPSVFATLIAERVKIPRVEAKTGTHTPYANCESGEKAGVPATKISQDQSPHTSHDSGRPVIVGPPPMQPAAEPDTASSKVTQVTTERTCITCGHPVHTNTGFQCVSCGRVAHDRCVAPERRTSKVCAECAPSKRATASAKRTATLIEKRQDALRCTKCDRPICAKAISCRICGRQFHVGCLSQPRRKTETCTDCVPQKRGKTMTNQHQDGEPGKDDTGKALLNDKLPKMSTTPTESTSYAPNTVPRTLIAPSNNDIRANLRDVPTNTVVDVTWSWRGEQGRWQGKLLRSTSPGLPTTFEAQRHLCEECHGWHEFGDHEFFKFPSSDVQYLEVTLFAPEAATIPECGSSEEGSDVSAEDLDEMIRGIETAGEVHENQEGPRQECGARTEAKAVLKDPLGNQDEFTPRSFQPRLAKPIMGEEVISWKIYDRRPRHVPVQTWGRCEESTHKTNVRWLTRLQDEIRRDPKLRHTSLATAAVETVTRWAKREKFKWPTISSAMSAISSAIEALPLYSDEPESVPIREHPVVKNAARYAAQQARIAAVEHIHERGLSYEQYKSLVHSIKCPRARSLLVVCWALASRVGDARRLQPRHVHIDNTILEGLADMRRIQATYTEGKGAKFWGPFTLFTTLSRPDSNTILEMARSVEPEQSIWTKEDQAALSNAIRKLKRETGENLSLRSIRRGSLQYLSQCGVPTAQIQLLSGHKKRSTLLIYLGLGEKETEASTAAEQRAAIVQAARDADLSGNLVEGEPTRGGGLARPMPMTILSGYAGEKGRRRQAWPVLMKDKAPKKSELGIEVKQDESELRRTLPLHIKDVKCMDWEAMRQMVKQDDLSAQIELSYKWTQSPEWYRGRVVPMAPVEVPPARLTAEQAQLLVKAGKLRLHDPTQPIFGFCRAFTVLEVEKGRQRVIFEPDTNQTLDKTKLPSLHYPTRLERRQMHAYHHYAVQFDLAAAYDQIGLGEKVTSYFCVRVGREIYEVTRLPMGSSFSAQVLQTCTAALIADALADEELSSKVAISTMIDNICVSSDDREALNRASDIIVASADRVGMEFKADLTGSSRPKVGLDFAALGQIDAEDAFVFLGEEYFMSPKSEVRGLVRNRTHNVEKLQAGYARLQAAATEAESKVPTQERKTNVTARQMISIMSLYIWMAHTLNVPAAKHHKLLQLYAKLCRLYAGDFDQTIEVQSNDVRTLGNMFQVVFANAWTEVLHLLPPAETPAHYDCVAVIDAYAGGWAATVRLPDNSTWDIKAGWRNRIPRSAHAEPKAATELIAWLELVGIPKNARVAIITDHIALVSAQRKYDSNYRGFSAAYFLNAFYEKAYDTFANVDLFHVPGLDNPVDKASREVLVGDPLSVRPSHYVFQSLLEHYNPCRSLATRRQWWQV